MKEKTFENRVKDFFKSEDIWFIKTHGDQWSRAGIPDIIACVGGVFLAVELKNENGKPSVLQGWTIEKIKKSGGIAYLLYPSEFERFKNTIREIKKEMDAP